MERCAHALAKSVAYVGAATVEYLFTLEDSKHYFLELNPRLQARFAALRPACCPALANGSETSDALAVLWTVKGERAPSDSQR